MIHKMVVTIVMALSLPLFAEAQVKPKITKPEAEHAALATVKGGKILSAEYEVEGGKHVWSVDVRLNRTIKEVWVNPVSGKVIKVEDESATHEKTERSKEMKLIPKSRIAPKRNSAVTREITKVVAGEIALKAVHGGTVLTAKKVTRDKVALWSVTVKTLKGTKDVLVSRVSGRVIKISGKGSSNGAMMPKK